MIQKSSFKLTAVGLLPIILLGLHPLVCRAQEFSADVVYLAGAAKPGVPATAAAGSLHEPSRLYASKDQLRLETRGLTGTILLANRGEHTSFALFPSEKAYQPLVSGPSQYFGVENAEDACSEWQKVATQKISCEKVGPEAVAGRQAVKYQSKAAPGVSAASVWIDSGLKYVVKWESAGASAELRNIKEGPQASDLFTVPAAYLLLAPRKGKAKGFGPTSH